MTARGAIRNSAPARRRRTALLRLSGLLRSAGRDLISAGPAERLKGTVDMPIYEYECRGCGGRHEFIQKFSDGPKRKCPSCGKLRLKKLISAAAFHLKGDGWYVTDFRDKGRSKDKGKPDSAESASESKSDTKSSESKSADSKSSSSGSKSGNESKTAAGSGDSPRAA